MKLRIVAVTLTKDDIRDTPYHILRETAEGVILQAGSDKPELWIPSEGLKSYRVIIKGKEYEFSKEVEDSNAATKRQPWVESGEKKAPHLSLYWSRRVKNKEKEG